MPTFNICHPFTNQPAPFHVYESVGGRASQRSADGYTHTSWHAVIHPVPPCSWHAISILNLNYPACFQHATLHPKPELATQRFLGCRLQVMSQPSMLRCDSGSSSLARCHAKIPLMEKKSGWVGRDLPLPDHFSCTCTWELTNEIVVRMLRHAKAKYPAHCPPACPPMLNFNKVKVHLTSRNTTVLYTTKDAYVWRSSVGRSLPV